uniref:DDE Tnp4 domain-containing protein n=1 Tax=Erpetoichthys calabaricus TaxID=27687 RepID=A0A8C4RCT9_ERPCA
MTSPYMNEREFHIERVLRDRQDPLLLHEEIIFKRYRFSRGGILYLKNLLHKTKRSPALSVEEHYLIALRFYASGTFYQVVGDNMGVDKSTVSNVVKAVSVELASLMAQTKQSFFLLGNMPNTIGFTDCTHVHIQVPHEREWQYVNRKGRHSSNVQLVANADLIITNSVVKWPGQCLSTPTMHLNGVLKRRFACRNYLRVEPKVACNIILACIVLHNIATRRNVPLDDIYDGPEPDEVQPEQPPMFAPNEGQTGRVVRDAIVRHYF